MDTDLALKLSKIIHDNCEYAPHDAGIRLIENSPFGVSFIQRTLRMGYNVALHFLKKLESDGFVKKCENSWQYEIIEESGIGYGNCNCGTEGCCQCNPW